MKINNYISDRPKNTARYNNITAYRRLRLSIIFPIFVHDALEIREHTLRLCISLIGISPPPGSPQAARSLVTEVSLILLPVIAIVTDAPYRLNIVQVAYRLPDSRRKVKGALYYSVFKERRGHFCPLGRLIDGSHKQSLCDRFHAAWICCYFHG